MSCGDFEVLPVGTAERLKRLEAVVATADVVLNSAFAANYCRITPFKELVGALAEVRGTTSSTQERVH